MQEGLGEELQVSKEGSINVCKQIIVVHEKTLRELVVRKEVIEKGIVSIEQDLEQERQKLAELESEGGE